MIAGRSLSLRRKRSAIRCAMPDTSTTPDLLELQARLMDATNYSDIGQTRADAERLAQERS